MNNCEICAFDNPKESTSAIIIKDNSVLLVKRAEEPFKGMWDFPGGYVNAGEKPEDAVKREILEELNLDGRPTLIEIFPGTSLWKGHKFAVNTHAFFMMPLGEGKIIPNKEIAGYGWMPLKDLGPEIIAFDSNQEIARYIKSIFTLDLPRARFLIQQLDPTATFNEQRFYAANLSGYVATRKENGVLVGFGSIFPRQTMLRNQWIIEDMVVDEAYRGKGYGTSIMNELLDWAKDNGGEMVELTTGHHRIAAGELYEKMNFVKHDTRHYLLKL